MISLHYLNTPLWLDGQVPSEKFQVKFNPIGPSEKLTMEDGTVWEDTHIAIPHKKHLGKLNFIYEGHLVLNKCKLRAKDCLLAMLEWAAR